MPIVYDLTPLTRGAAVQRRVVIKTVEVRHQRLMVIFLAFIPAVILAAVAWQVVASWALLVFGAVQFLAVWLFDTRSRTGLGQSNARALRQRIRAQTGQFMVAGEPFNPLSARMGEVVVATVRAPAVQESPPERIAVEEGQW